MKAAATLAYANAVAEGRSQEVAKDMARKVRESWTTSPATVTEHVKGEHFKACGSCHRSLPRTSFSDKQWVNKKFRGEGRRCSSCLVGVDLDPVLMASTVASIASRSESFLADWTEAWRQVQDEMPQTHAKAVVLQDAYGVQYTSSSRSPPHPGRLLAALIRNLDRRGASKAEKVAHRALAEEYWAALTGRPQLAPATHAMPRANPGVDASRAAKGGWMGGAGLLATADTGRGKAGRGGKILAAAELAAAVMQHFPALGLGPDIATDLIFLPCHVPCGGGLPGREDVPASSDGGAALAVQNALSAIHAAGCSFAHVHRAWAVCETAATATQAVLAGRRLLTRAMQAQPDATFAIRCEAYPPRDSMLGRSELVATIAAGCGHPVDLVSPDVCLLLRGVQLGGVAQCALALERRNEPSALRCDHGDDAASEGRPYFVREANGAPPPSDQRAPRGPVDETDLDGLIARLEGALTDAAAILSPASRHALYRTGIENEAGASEAGETKHACTQPESLYVSGKARDRHRRAAGATQSKSISAMITDAGLLASPPPTPRPAPGSAFRTAGAALPTAGSALPADGSTLPTAGSALPAAGAALQALPTAGSARARFLIGSGRPRSGVDPLQPSVSAIGSHRRVWTVEFGAGAGELSRQLAADASRIASGPLGGQILLDRSCGRGGSMQATLAGDRWEEAEPRLLSGRTTRLRVDIRHVHLPGLAELTGVAVAAVGKHVCGAATDLMLRSVVTPIPGPGEDFECRGIGVALCCHHLCTLEDYVNPGYVAEAGLSHAEFGAVCRLSSWANIDRNATRSRQRVGLTCKAFLDVGRCLYLRERGFDASLVAYCSPDETPENRLLLAKKLCA